VLKLLKTSEIPITYSSAVHDSVLKVLKASEIPVMHSSTIPILYKNDANTSSSYELKYSFCVPFTRAALTEFNGKVRQPKSPDLFIPR
jgi:hypothetical protein